MAPELRDLIGRTWRALDELGADRRLQVDCVTQMVRLARPAMTHRDTRAAVRFVMRQSA